jgi:hypothetical protein
VLRPQIIADEDMFSQFGNPYRMAPLDREAKMNVLRQPLLALQNQQVLLLYLSLSLSPTPYVFQRDII